jgi:hypothetical protein
MKTCTLVPLLAVCAALPATAQGGRFSFELGGARATNSEIFEQTVSFITPNGGTTATRLALDGGTLGAARIAYRTAGGWMLVADLGHGSARYVYTHDVTASSLGGSSTETRTGGASRTTLGIAVAHRTEFLRLPLSVEPEIGIALHRLTVGNPGVQCIPQAPTLGGPTDSCATSEQWEQVYSVPSASAGLSLGYAIAPRLAVELRGLYAIGRTSTEKGFYVDFIPDFDYAEAPKSKVIRSTQLFVGLRVTP